MSNLNETIIRETFGQAYNREKFTRFTRELLTGIQERGTIHVQIPTQFKDYIQSYYRVGKYVYNDGFEKIIDVLEVKLKRNNSIEHARAMQRNFVARYLNGAFGDIKRDAALVAFISEDAKDWRFSFVKMDYKSQIITQENGKQKRIIEKELTPAKRFSFLVGENEYIHTAQKQLFNCLSKASGGKQITLEDLVEAFDIEKVSKEFFDEYKKLYIRLRDELKRIYDFDKKIHKDFDEHNINIDDFAKKTLGQLVFLYFVQKKGWLGVKSGEPWGSGEKRFLRKLFDKEYVKYDNFFNDILEPLFYRALARDRGNENDNFAPLNCRIPFLNGGLFEPINGYGYAQTDLTIDNAVFKEIFDVFDLYNFTVKEDEPLEKEVAIDPEMLGKVFENLLPENERKGNGAFYTPREIVHYMCQESLINYLYNAINTQKLTQSEAKQDLLFAKKKVKQTDLKLEKFEEIVSKEDISTFIKLGESTYTNSNRGINEDLPSSIKENAVKINQALKDVKICDPAIGSGAFPVGMMNEIVRARLALEVENKTTYQIKREIIENNLYGVDIDDGAVEIAKLRFWLSLIVDEEDISNIKPLPNLDYKVMQGNSLITSYEGINFDEIVEDYKPKNVQLDFNYFGSQSDNIITSINNLMYRYIKVSHDTEKLEIRNKIEQEIVNLVKSKVEEKAKQGGIQWDKAEQTIRDFAQNRKHRNFFPWKLFFADVFMDGGFDIVVGNPPYGLINKRQNKAETIVVTEEDYNFYKNSREYSSATTGSINIFRLFIVKSIELLKTRGSFCEIFPLAFVADLSAKKLRESILKNHCITSIEAFPERDNEAKRVFKSAKISACIANIQKDVPQKEFFIRMNSEPFVEYNKEKVFIDYSKIQLFDPVYYTIPLLSNEDINLLTKVFNKGQKLETFAHCYTGEIDLSLNADLLSLDDSYCEMIKGAIIDRYIKRKKMSQGEIMYLKESEYLKNNTSKKSRHHCNKRIVMQGITGVNEKHRLKMTIIPEGIYCANSVNYIVFDDNSNIDINSILGMLNSRLLDYVFKKFSTNSNVNGYEVDALPICLTDKKLAGFISRYVTLILDLTKTINYEYDETKQKRVRKYEDEIDLMVYKLYNLTYSEVLTVDKDFKLSEKEYNEYKLN